MQFAHSLHGKTEFLKLCLPAACLDKTDSKSARTGHETSPMTTMLLPIQNPLPLRPRQKGADVGYVRLHFSTEVRTVRSPVISPSLHLHDQKIEERHHRNVLINQTSSEKTLGIHRRGVSGIRISTLTRRPSLLKPGRRQKSTL